MTLEEARQTLKEVKCYPELDDWDRLAVNMAIKALKIVDDIKSVNADTIHKAAMTYITICDIIGEFSDDGREN